MWKYRRYEDKWQEHNCWANNYCMVFHQSEKPNEFQKMPWTQFFKQLWWRKQSKYKIKHPITYIIKESSNWNNRGSDPGLSQF